MRPARRAQAPGTNSVTAGPAGAKIGAMEFRSPFDDDPAPGGPAEAITRAMLADGVDIMDTTAVQAWMEAFNNRPFEDRDAVLGPALDARSVELPLRAQPRDEEVAASAGAAPILAKFDVLAEFFAAERPLTPNGNLKLADARALVDLLETGDLFDEKFGDRVYKTRSAEDLPNLRLLVEWAKASGVLRVQRGRLVAIKRWAQLRRDPRGAHRRAIEGLMKIGPLLGYYGRAYLWDEIDFFDEGAVHFLAAVWCSEDEPTPIDRIVEHATQSYAMRFQWPDDYPEEACARTAEFYVSTIFTSWELAGVTIRTGTEEYEEYGRTRLRRGAVQLTPSGVVIARELLPDAGYLAPLAGSQRDEPAVAILGAIPALGKDRVLAELAVWASDRSGPDAAAELVDAVRVLEDPDALEVAFAALGAVGEAAEPYVNKLMDTPLRGHAVMWRVQMGLEPGVASGGTPDEGLALCAALLAAGGAPAVVEAIGGWPLDTQLALVDDFRRLDSPDAGPVLDAVGRHHHDRVVAKAARKAAMQWRSRSTAPGT